MDAVRARTPVRIFTQPSPWFASYYEPFNRGETQVLSLIIYNHVEALDHDAAHRLAGGMLAFAFIALLLLNLFRPGRQR